MATAALAVVIGDIDLVRTLGLAGITSVFAGASDASARFSRHVAGRCCRGRTTRTGSSPRCWSSGAQQPEPPVLYPQTDAALLLAARRRDELGRAFRFALADTALVDDLVEKDRFQALAERRGLPVPARAPAGDQRPDRPPGARRRLPARREARRSAPATGRRWRRAARRCTCATRTSGPRSGRGWRRRGRTSSCSTSCPARRRRWRATTPTSTSDGAVAGEFTGRKIRTYPARYGYSTAVEVVELPDVAALGRDVLDALGLRGVAKVDFKRDARGRLHLLEVNPRFNLWHHPAAVAGVNLPGARPRRPHRRAASAGPPRDAAVTWCTPLTDLRAAHAHGMSLLRWMRFARRCDVVSGLSRDDPLPFLRGTLPSAVAARASPTRAAPADALRRPRRRPRRTCTRSRPRSRSWPPRTSTRYLCAGDLVGYGPLPNECVRRVLGLGGPCVAGNHDLIALGGWATSAASRSPAPACAGRAACSTTTSRAMLAALPLDAIGRTASRSATAAPERPAAATSRASRRRVACLAGSA